MRTAALAWSLLAGAAALGLAGCGGDPVHAGNAFVQGYAITSPNGALSPGNELGLLDLYLNNQSGSTVVINSIGITGPGIGTVVKPVQVKMAPLRFGRHDYEANAVPESDYYTDPPVNHFSNGCRKQALFPVKGFKMTDGSQSRVWIVIRALRPGKWVIPQHVIYYTIGGTRYREALPLRQSGTVKVNAPYLGPDSSETTCVRPEHTHYLPGFHA